MELCHFSKPVTDKLYECNFPAMCALQTPYEGGEVLYCITAMIASKRQFIESELEKKARDANFKRLEGMTWD